CARDRIFIRDGVEFRLIGGRAVKRCARSVTLACLRSFRPVPPPTASLKTGDVVKRCEPLCRESGDLKSQRLFEAPPDGAWNENKTDSPVPTRALNVRGKPATFGLNRLPHAQCKWKTGY